MKKLVLAVIISMLGSAAHASGFTCTPVDGNPENAGYRFKMTHNNDPSIGTRTLAYMGVSDINLQEGNRTVVASDNSDLIGKSGNSYYMKIDERFAAVKKGELLMGTKLDVLKGVQVDMVNFNPAVGGADGQVFIGTLILVFDNGSKPQAFPMACTYYLKGE